MSGYRIKPAPERHVEGADFSIDDYLPDRPIWLAETDGEGIHLSLSEALALREWLDSVIEEVKS